MAGHYRTACLSILSSAFVVLHLSDTEASTAPQHLCDLAVERAAEKFDVPTAVLLAISRTETGRRLGGELAPWPWTLNVEGHGVFFGSKTEALTHVFHQIRSGVTRIDIGCFQINLHWHGLNFPSLEAMLDPELNAAYAAQFLRKLYDEHGGWIEAIGAFHSRTPEYSRKYIDRFRPILAEVTRDGETSSHSQRYAAHIEDFPLSSRTSDRKRSGSLFPLSRARNQPFIRYVTDEHR